MRNKATSTERPTQLLLATPTMVNVIDEATIEEHENEEGKFYTYEEDRYTPQEYVSKLIAENTALKSQVGSDNEVILDLDYRVSVLEEG